jgi:hypothetical protein
MVLLCPIKMLTFAVFLWIKGCANFEPTTPGHKKRIVMRHVQLNRGPRLENHCIAFNFNSSQRFLNL